jgi:hypothetical protein
MSAVIAGLIYFRDWLGLRLPVNQTLGTIPLQIQKPYVI